MPLAVITLTNVPKSLRGDLSKWMQEIATGVYVGNFNTKIREQLWTRVKENIGEGQATISYYYRNEIGYKFDTINTHRQSIDFDGIPLVMVLNQCDDEKEVLKSGFSKASKLRKAKKYQKIDKKQGKNNYAIIDIETTGLDEKRNAIIEIAALKYEDSRIIEFNQLIKTDDPVPDNITKLTGIKKKDLDIQGIDLETALNEFLDFIGNLDLVGYNIDFDIKFINYNLVKLQKEIIKNKKIDLLNYVKKEKMFLKNYKLETVVREYGIDKKVDHRALSDCRIIYDLSRKVNKFVENYK